MRRRTFIVGLVSMVGTAGAARAQEAPVPLVGYVGGSARFTHLLAAFHRGLKEAGYVEGESVTIEYRWVAEDYTALPAVMDELLRAKVRLIVVAGGTQAIRAAKAASKTTPIVFLAGADPTRFGIVANLNRPEGNVTGVTLFAGELAEKRLALLREFVPNAHTVGALINPASSSAEIRRVALTAAARALGLKLAVAEASRENLLRPAFDRLREDRVEGLVVQNDVFFNSHPEALVALAAEYRIPAIFEGREYAAVGGLVSYGPSRQQAYRQLGVYAGRVLRGKSPAELPVQQPTSFELIINMKTASALGLAVPLSLQAQADEVIE
jgi:putative tryptophan/tyrosine transport system substrate-binding protein